MNRVPSYLQGISTDVQQRKHTVCFHIMCTCQSRRFTVYRNAYTEQEQAEIENWKKLLKKYNGGGYSDQNGNVFLCKKRIFGFRSKIRISRAMIPDLYDSFKIKCAECGREYVIFDSRLHGYDARAERDGKNRDTDIATHYRPLPLKGDSGPVELIVRIRNELTDEITADRVGDGLAQADVSNAFSFISVYAKSGPKTKMIFSRETA